MVRRISPSDLRELAPDLVHSGAARWSSRSPARNAIIHAAMEFDKAVWLPGNILARGDRMTMAAGVEMRMPFMDTALADFAAGLPEAAFVTGRTGKTILRRAIARHLPPEIYERKKYGFRVPFHEWCRGALRPMLEERLLDPAAISHAFVRRKVIERMLAEHMRRKRNHEKALWSLLGLEIHLRQLAEGVPPGSSIAESDRLPKPDGTG
jgi:asparagine synthase (glutamine-hydrolysing)